MNLSLDWWWASVIIHFSSFHFFVNLRLQYPYVFEASDYKLCVSLSYVVVPYSCPFLLLNLFFYLWLPALHCQYILYSAMPFLYYILLMNQKDNAVISVDVNSTHTVFSKDTFYILLPVLFSIFYCASAFPKVSKANSYLNYYCILYKHVHLCIYSHIYININT